MAGFNGVEYQFVRTFTQPLPSTTGKLVSANSKPSATGFELYLINDYRRRLLREGRLDELKELEEKNGL